MGITRVTRNFQVTLPKDVREISKIREGDKLIVTMEDHDVIKMKKIEEDVLKEAFGSWKRIKGSSVEYVRKMRSDWGKRRKRLGV